MTGAFAVDLVELEATIDAIARLDALLEQKLAEVESRVNQLQNVWTGAAADAAHAAHVEWLAGANEMRAALAALRAAASTAQANYQSAIDANVRNWAL